MPKKRGFTYYCQFCGTTFTGPGARNRAIACERQCLAERRAVMTTAIQTAQGFDTGAGERWIAAHQDRIKKSKKKKGRRR